MRILIGFLGVTLLVGATYFLIQKQASSPKLTIEDVHFISQNQDETSLDTDAKSKKLGKAEPKPKIQAKTKIIKKAQEPVESKAHQPKKLTQIQDIRHESAPKVPENEELDIEGDKTRTVATMKDFLPNGTDFHTQLTDQARNHTCEESQCRPMGRDGVLLVGVQISLGGSNAAARGIRIGSWEERNPLVYANLGHTI